MDNTENHERKGGLIITPASQTIASEIAKQMRDQHIGAMKLERMLDGKVNMYAVRRIRKGSSGCLLRSYEQVLDALNLRLCVVPKHHPDIID